MPLRLIIAYGLIFLMVALIAGWWVRKRRRDQARVRERHGPRND